MCQLKARIFVSFNTSRNIERFFLAKILSQVLAIETKGELGERLD